MKILMIINEFPPTGESGVQRALKFVKYLTRMGNEVHVITPRKPVKNVLDYSLLQDIPVEARIHYTTSLGVTGKAVENIAITKASVTKDSFIASICWKTMKAVNDFIFPYDKQIGWVPFAYLEACRVLKKYQIKNVYITSYPFSAQLVGLMLKAKFGKSINYIADYRDSWQFEPKINENMTKYRLAKVRKMDTQILRKCDKFTVATQQILDEYLSIVPELKAKATVILNGYDEDDFLNIVPVKYSSFTFLYMGKIYDYKRSPIPLLEAFKNCCEKTQFQMIHIGTIPGNTLKKIKDTYGFYQFLGYKSHNEALNMAAGADVLIVIVNNDVQSKGVITGKVFEYIKLSKPILAICPKGGILEIMINQYNLGIAVPPDDEPGIITAIQKIINYSIHSMDDSVYKFSREFQAKQLRDVCEDI